MVLRHPRFLLSFSYPIMLIIWALIYATKRYVEPELVGQSGIAAWLALTATAFVSLVLLSFHAIGWHKQVHRALEPISVRSIFQWRTLRIYLLTLIVTALPAAALTLAIGFVWYELVISHFPMWMAHWPLWTFVFVNDHAPIMVTTLAFSLFGFGFPAAALGHRIGWRAKLLGGWRNGLPLLTALVLVTIGEFFVDRVVTHLNYALLYPDTFAMGWFETGAWFLIGPLFALGKIAVLTLVYLDWYEKTQRSSSVDFS